MSTTASTSTASTSTASTSTASTSTPVTSTTSTSSRRPLWLVATGAVVAGAVVTGGFEAATRAVGVPYAFGLPGAEPADMPVSGLAFAVLEFGVIGIVLAVCLARRARRPRSTWQRTTVALTALSLLPSLVAASTSYATNVALAVSHLVAAAVIIPLVARRLPATNPGR